MNKFRLLSATILMSVIAITSCKKDAGEGGTSSIHGKILVHHLNSFQQFDTTYYDANSKVYIIYGTDHETYDNDYSTSWDGSYIFQYLQNGTYKLFTFSVDTTGLSQGTFDPNRPKIPVFATAKITGKKQDVSVPDFVVIKYN